MATLCFGKKFVVRTVKALLPRPAMFLEAYTEGNAAPSPNDGCLRPVSKRKAFDRERVAELLRLLSRTELLVAGFVGQCRLSDSFPE